MAEEIERIYIIPLKKTNFKSSNAAPSAVKRVKTYLMRHMKVEEKDIWIDNSLNNTLWSKGKYNMPSKIRVKAVKFDDGVVEVYVPEMEFKKSRRELLKEEREKKEPILRKEEIPEEGEEGEGVPGAEEYDIAPTVDGKVKIKKKKTPKEKEEKETKEKKPAAKKKETKKSEKIKEKKEKQTKKKTSSKPKKTTKRSKSATTKKKQIKK